MNVSDIWNLTLGPAWSVLIRNRSPYTGDINCGGCGGLIEGNVMGMDPTRKILYHSSCRKKYKALGGDVWGISPMPNPLVSRRRAEELLGYGNHN